MAKQYTVLLIDDNKLLLEMYRRKFEQNGAQVDIAVGSEEALSKLRAGAKPDILILDSFMPGMNGPELLEVIHREKLAPDSSVIMLTNESAREKVAQAKKLGLNGYIIKATRSPAEIVEEAIRIAKVDSKAGAKK